MMSADLCCHLRHPRFLALLQVMAQAVRGLKDSEKHQASQQHMKA